MNSIGPMADPCIIPAPPSGRSVEKAAPERVFRWNGAGCGANAVHSEL